MSKPQPLLNDNDMRVFKHPRQWVNVTIHEYTDLTETYPYRVPTLLGGGDNDIMENWCEERYPDAWCRLGHAYRFKHQEDAALFKMFFG